VTVTLATAALLPGIIGDAVTSGAELTPLTETLATRHTQAVAAAEPSPCGGMRQVRSPVCRQREIALAATWPILNHVAWQPRGSRALSSFWLFSLTI
jgi:hypothetical protein